MIAHCPQVIHVSASSLQTTYATVTLTSCGTRAGGPWRARVGRNGLSADHHEGEETTPLGTYAIGPVVYGVAANPGVTLRYHRLVCGDWWDEDPASTAYNTFQHVACGRAPPFGGGSEALWESPRAYRFFAVVEYNAARVPGRGSGIFLHVDTGSATNGCVTLPVADLVQTLRWLRAGARIRIAA